MDWISAFLFHSTLKYTVTTRLKGTGVLQHRLWSEFRHGHKEALGHRHITTRACSKVESSEPGTTKVFPFGLRRCSKIRVFGDEKKAVFRNPVGNDCRISQVVEDRTKQITPHISMTSAPRCKLKWSSFCYLKCLHWKWNSQVILNCLSETEGKTCKVIRVDDNLPHTDKSDVTSESEL